MSTRERDWVGSRAGSCTQQAKQTRIWYAEVEAWNCRLMTPRLLAPLELLHSMNDRIPELIPAVVSYTTEHGGYVTKTKLLKLLYLIDVDFYRVHQETLTGFQWKYFHLGPWTNEFDPILDQLIATDLLQESRSSKSEFDTKFLHSTESSDLSRLFDTYKDVAVVKIVLDTSVN